MFITKIPIEYGIEFFDPSEEFLYDHKLISTQCDLGEEM